MSGELAVLLFVGNVVLFWLWTSHLIPLLHSKLGEARGPCPHCGRHAQGPVSKRHVERTAPRSRLDEIEVVQVPAGRDA